MADIKKIKVGSTTYDVHAITSDKLAIRFTKSSEASTAVGYYRIATITHINWSYCSFTMLVNNSYSGTLFNTLFDVRCADNATSLQNFAFHVIGGDDISSKLAYLETRDSSSNITKIEIFMRCSRFEHPAFYLISQNGSGNTTLDINSVDWGDNPDKADSTTMTGNATNTILAANAANAWRLNGQLASYYATASSLNNYLPLAGGAMTGNISYKGTNSTTPIIKFKDNTSDAYGNGIAIGGGGIVVIGAGESSDLSYSSVGDENLYLAADTDIHFYTNAQNGLSSAKHIVFNTSGVLQGMNSIVATHLSGGGSEYKITSNTYSLSFMIGSGDVNRGIFDHTNGDWMIYRDGTTNIYLNGAIYENGTALSSKYQAKGTYVNTVNSKSGAVTVSGSFSGTKTNALVTGVSVNSQGSVTLTANDATATGRITYVQSISGSAPSLGGTTTFVTGYGSFSGGSGSLTSNDTSSGGIAYIASHTNASLGTASTGTVGISGASYTPAGSVTVTSTRTTSGSGDAARRVLTITSSFSGTAATITPSLTGTKTFVTGYPNFSGGGSTTKYLHHAHTGASLGTASTGTVSISGGSYSATTKYLSASHSGTTLSVSKGDYTPAGSVTISATN